MGTICVAAEYPTGECPSSHLGLVYSFARAPQYQDRGLTREELVSAAYVGLDHACRSSLFDPSQSKFSTYASWCIINAIRDAIKREHHLIYIPNNTLQAMFEGVESPTTVAAAKAYTVDHLWCEIVAPADEAEAADRDDESGDHPELAAALAQLRVRDADVLRMRFGLGGDKPMTLEQVSKVFGVTKERIRQLEMRAKDQLRKLMEPSGKEGDPR